MKPINPAIKQAIRNVYAWPGGYPMHLVMEDGGCLCMACARKEWRTICHSTMHGFNDGWNAATAQVNWEDNDMTCDHCNSPIESAYGSDEP